MSAFQLVAFQADNAVYKADLARTEFNLGFTTDVVAECLQFWERSRSMRRELLLAHLGQGTSGPNSSRIACVCRKRG